MPKVVALDLMVSDKKVFQDLEKKLISLIIAMATGVFEGTKFFHEILKRSMSGTCL